MRQAVTGTWDSSEENHSERSFSCPQGETCTVELEVNDVDDAPVDVTTAVITARIFDGYGQVVQTATSPAWDAATRKNCRELTLLLARLDPGTYSYAVQCVIGSRTCQIVRVSSLTVLP